MISLSISGSSTTVAPLGVLTPPMLLGAGLPVGAGAVLIGAVAGVAVVGADRLLVCGGGSVVGIAGVIWLPTGAALRLLRLSMRPCGCVVLGLLGVSAPVGGALAGAG